MTFSQKILFMSCFFWVAFGLSCSTDTSARRSELQDFVSFENNDPRIVRVKFVEGSSTRFTFELCMNAEMQAIGCHKITPFVFDAELLLGALATRLGDLEQMCEIHEDQISSNRRNSVISILMVILTFAPIPHVKAVQGLAWLVNGIRMVAASTAVVGAVDEGTHQWRMAHDPYYQTPEQCRQDVAFLADHFERNFKAQARAILAGNVELQIPVDIDAMEDVILLAAQTLGT